LVKKEKVNIHVDPGEEAFFTDTVTVSHTQAKFVIDFSQTTPRFDYIGDSHQQVFVIKHRVVIMDPVVAKNFLNILKENIKKYEKKFGKIETPKKKKKEKDVASSPEGTRYIG